MKRILLCGFVAGIALFIWLSFIHLATPLAQVGIRALPNEANVVASIKTNIPREGFYFFPGAVAPPNSTRAEKQAVMNAAMERMKTGPTGIMVVYPNGKNPLVPSQLITEFLSNVVQGILLAWLLSRSMMTTMGEKVRFALAVGLAATFVTNVSYWNFYGFPTDYTLAYMFGEVSGYVVMGLTIAVMTLQTSIPRPV